MTLSAEEIVELSKRYTLFDWSAQSKVMPMPVDHAEGVYFFTTDGTRYLDFNSQLMGVNIGHGDKRVIDAIAKQGETLPYVTPFAAYETRALLGRKLAELWPGDLEKTFFTLGGAEANENAVRMAKAFTGRQKVMVRYRAYHGATYLTSNLTGDPRRWAEREPTGARHRPRARSLPRARIDREETAEQALDRLEEQIMLEGAGTIAAFVLETVTGTNGVLIPPDGYLQGVRELCTRYGIVMIADEVMCGFGRTGEWFAVNHWDVVPDLLTAAKGLTSSYLPLGAVAISPAIAAHFEDNVFAGGLTYNSHPLSCAAALAAIERAGGGRPGRQREAAGAGRCAGTTRSWRPRTRASGCIATSGCSASSSWSRTATRWSRCRPTTSRTRRWSRSTARCWTAACSRWSAGTAS